MSLYTKPFPAGIANLQTDVVGVFNNRKKTNANNIQLPLRSPKQTPAIQRSLLKCNKNVVTNPINCTSRKNKKSTSSDVLKLMDSLNLPIPLDVYVSLIEECTLSRDSAKASELHSHLINASLEPTLPFLNRLLLMYISCGDLASARKMFDEMPVRRDSTSWAIMILGHFEIGLLDEGISFFVSSAGMFFECSVLSTWVLCCVIRASKCTTNLGLGLQVHGLLLKLGGASDSSLEVNLIDFYRKFGYLKDADFLFDHLSRRNTFAWTAKIENSSREGRLVEAINAFNEMGREGVRRNSFTFSSALKACARLDEDDDDHVKCGRQLHANAIKLGLESFGFVECGLVDMYGKCGVVGDAKRVFETTTNKRNIACWNAMVMGLVKNGFHVESLKALYQMKAFKIEIQQSLIDEVRIACGGAACFTKQS